MENEQFTSEQKEFLGIIRNCRRRMNAAQTWEKLAAALTVGAVFGLGFEAASFILPLYFANLYALLAVCVSVVTGLVIAYRQRVSEAAAALKIDSFGFEERVITAYEGMTRGTDRETSGFFRLQQADAMRRLREGKDRIKVALCPSVKKLVLCAALLAAVIVLAIVPSAMKERAKELHAVRQESEEKQKEIEEIVEELEELAAEELPEEQLAALQEMMNSLQSSIAEYEQATSAKALAAAGQKLDYKYTDMSNQLADLAESLKNGAAVSSPAAKAMEEMSQNLQSKGKNTEGSGQSGNGQNGEGWNGENPQGGNGENNGDGGSSNGENGNNGGDGSGSGENGGDGNNNQNGSGQGSENGDGGDSGQNGENRNNGPENNPNGDGQNGEGSGNGNENGGGQGGDGSQNGGGQNGNGGQSGNSNGGGQGNGRGTGTANINRDYISVPNEIGDDETLTGQAGSSEYSETFKAQNGLSWEGKHVTYESVIGEYQKKAYEGISGGKYPSGMEDVIKEYFGSFNE